MSTVDQNLDQILLLIGGVLGGFFSLLFLLAWMEPAQTPSESVVRRPAVRVRLATLLGVLAAPGAVPAAAAVIPGGTGVASTPTFGPGDATLVA